MKLHFFKKMFCFVLGYITSSQSCDSFRWTGKGLSHTYTCVYSPPIQVATMSWELGFFMTTICCPSCLSGGSDGKESAWNVEDPPSIPGSGRLPGEREWLLTPVFFPGEFQGQRSLAGYSPWHHKTLYMTEWLTLNIYWIIFTYWYSILNSNMFF